MEVGEVIQFYDSDKRFPAWGSGGHIPGEGVSHCFNLNGSPGSSGSEVRDSLFILVQWFFLYSSLKMVDNCAVMMLDCS